MKSHSTVEGERAESAMLSGPRNFPRGARIALVAAMASFGLSLLGWYAYHLRGEHPGQQLKELGASRHMAASEMTLPPIEVGHRDTAPVPLERSVVPSAVPPETVLPLPAPLRSGRRGGSAAETAMESMVPTSSAAPVLVRAEADLAGSGRPSADVAEITAGGPVDADSRTPPGPNSSGAGAIVDATILPDGRWLMQKGSFLDCTLETAIDSTLPGLATCVLSADVYGSDGRVVLMERGTRLVGEVRGDVHAGQSRVAVAWTDARTPAGVRLTFVSMATDSVGRSGMPGVVDRHFGERFGAAVLMSFVEGAAAGLTSRQQGSGAVVYNAQASRDIATEALRSSIGIPPTIRVAQGARLQVIVGSDVNFRNVYRLAVRDSR